MSHVNKFEAFYNERAAIMEFDAGFIREEAELFAFTETTFFYLQERHPDILNALRKLTRFNKDYKLPTPILMPAKGNSRAQTQEGNI